MSLNKLMEVSRGQDLKLQIGAEIIDAVSIVSLGQDLVRPSHGLMQDTGGQVVNMPTLNQQYKVSTVGAVQLADGDIEAFGTTGLSCSTPGIYRITCNLTFFLDKATEMRFNFIVGPNGGVPNSEWVVSAHPIGEVSSISLSTLVEVTLGASHGTAYWEIGAEHGLLAGVDMSVERWNITVDHVSALPLPP